MPHFDKRKAFMKILIVEDDSRMREMIKRVIGDCVDQVYQCSDGCDVTSLYEAERPDWVLMDICMETLDGLEATRLLTATWPDARVLIVTGFKDESLRQAGHNSGARGYVLKENLFEIRHWLESKNNST
jgi:CheY-like chemotaxis protein